MVNRKILATRLAGLLAVIPGMNAMVASLARSIPSLRVVQSTAYYLAQANASAPGSDTKIATLIGGAKLVVTFEELLFRLVYFFGSHEPELSRLLLRIAKPGQTWIDIGANIGVFTMTLAKTVGANGKVLAIEPNPKLAKLIEESVGLNGFRNVTVREVALGEVSGRLSLNIPRDPEKTPGGSGRSTLIASDSLQDVDSVQVTVSTLDSEIASFGEIYGIKMDVEGFEKAVLKGASQLFTERPPRVVVMEVSRLPEALAGPEELLDIFREYGYECYLIPCLTHIPRNQPYTGGLCDNVLAIHDRETGLLEILAPNREKACR